MSFLPFYISLFFSLLGLGFLRLAFSKLVEERLWYEKAREREFQLQHCVGIKITLLNLENAYLYSKKLNPEKELELHETKAFYEELLRPFLKERVCSGAPLLSLQAFPHKERNPKLPEFWPNWNRRFQ